MYLFMNIIIITLQNIFIIDCHNSCPGSVFEKLLEKREGCDFMVYGNKSFLYIGF